jgi:hypothetical protein
LLWLSVARAIGLPLVPWSFPGDGVLLKLQLPACSGGAYLADPSHPGSLLVLPDYADSAAEAAFSADGSYYSSADASTADESSKAAAAESWAATMALPGAAIGGAGVKVLGPAAAAELAPMSLGRLMGYALMDVKRTYLMTGMMEDALAVIRWVLGVGVGGGGWRGGAKAQLSCDRWFIRNIPAI